MAGPVGHIVSALALLNNPLAEIVHKNDFLLGTSFPDIRYISEISRAKTHMIHEVSVAHVMKAQTDFEKGRRFHVFLDYKREDYMKKNDAYRFLPKGPLKTQLLKLVEDKVLFSQLQGFNPEGLFIKIHPEEKTSGMDEKEINRWHTLLTTYLKPDYWFNFSRYFRSLWLFQEAYGLPKELTDGFFAKMRTFGFLVYAYFQLEKLSRNEELRTIILNFYNREFPRIINEGLRPGQIKKSEKQPMASGRTPLFGRLLSGRRITGGTEGGWLPNLLTAKTS